MKRPFLAVVVSASGVFLVVCFLACGGGGQPPVDSPVGPARATGFSARVSPATSVQLDKIAFGLQKDCSLRRHAAWMVKSSNHGNAYYVAAYFDGPGVPGSLGAWFLSGDPNDPNGMILSADAIAVAFSEWPDGSRTKAEAYLTDRDCSDLLDYARARR